MFKRVLKWIFGIVVVVGDRIAIFLINLIWFRPWSLNLFYEKGFRRNDFQRAGTAVRSSDWSSNSASPGHNGKLSDESPAHQQKVIDRWKKICGSCMNIR